MEKENFGKLVQALRKEHRDEIGKLWTQEILAQKTKLSKRTIERIEDGSLQKLDGDTLLRLADALELTTMERKEFFFAAIGIEHSKLASSRNDPFETISTLLSTLKSINLPAFVNDVYADIIAANTAIIKLLEIPDELISQAPYIPGGYNTMRVVYSPESKFRTIVGEQWTDSAQHNMQFFRGISLRYRVNPYFEQVLSTLRTYPAFRRYWEQAHLEEEDTSADNVRYEYNHPNFGPLNYLANISTSVTKLGELYSVIYIPLNSKTVDVFRNLVEQHGNDVIELAPWPK